MNSQVNNLKEKVIGEGKGREVNTAHRKVANQAIVDPEIEKDQQVAVVLTIIIEEQKMINKISVT